MTGHNGMTSIVLALALTLAATGCGPDSHSVVDAQSEALVDGNGLSRNGLSRNGLSRNGLSRNGLSRNGLDKAEFVSWFNEDTASSNTLMKYLYACAAASGTSVTWKNPTTGVTHSWSGVLGLAKAFAGGAALSRSTLFDVVASRLLDGRSRSRSRAL